MRTVRLPDGIEVPALGQGTWQMGERRERRAVEIRSLRLGVELGLTLIDTAEMYGEGRTEELVAEALAACAKRCSWSARSTLTTRAAGASSRRASAA